MPICRYRRTPERQCHIFGAILGLLGTGCSLSVAPSAPPPSPASSPASDFTLQTKAAGITYHWEKWWKEPGNIRETLGNGCAFLDYDNDGNLDILLVGKPTALYRGDGSGRFTDVSHATGMTAFTDRFIGCAVGDYNNDGFSDIYLSAHQGGRLVQNINGRRFADVTRSLGVPAQPFGTSCCFVDMSGDGYLDLFVGNYVAFTGKTDPQLCEEKGYQTACGPRFYRPEFGTLLLNRQGKRFVPDKTLFPGTSGKVLGVASIQLPGAGRPTLALANDEMPGDLITPEGSRYANTGERSGTAYDAAGNIHGGMGVDWGDFDNDGRVDLFVATFNEEAKSLYRNTGEGVFEEVSAFQGLVPLNPLVSFGVKFLDYDNDGFLDLLIASGHIQDNIAKIDPEQGYRQPVALFRNRGGNGFEETTGGLPAAAQRPIVGRGVAIGDYDNDGKMDVLIVDSEGAPLLLHNENRSGNRFIGFRLREKSGRDAYHARVVVKAGGKTYVRFCNPGGSYLSSSDPRVLVGIGMAERVESVTVHWPDGTRQTLNNLAVNQYHTICQGSSAR